MNKTKNNFNIYFENKDLSTNKQYSKTVVKSLVRSFLEPVATNNSNAVVFTRLKDIEDIDGLIKRLEYLHDVTLKEFSDFEFSKFDVEEIGFVILNSPRYNCAFLFKEVEKDKFEIYLKLNSKLVGDVYETLKSIFFIDYDEKFYKHRPERRENDVMNKAVYNILDYFEETIQDSEYNSKMQENYRSVNEANTTFRNEMYQNVRTVAHEIKNQLSILDIYARIFEKKTQDYEITKPLRKSIELIKSQINQFRDFDIVNLQEKDVKSVIQESIRMYAFILKEKKNKLILIDEMPEVTANAFIDEEKFLLVVNNIIKNAHDCTKNDEITIKLRQKGDNIEILFINHGEMIKRENRDKIFETGYTTKKDGWGVGLASCRKFIGSQFGTLELTKSDKDETIFTLVVPLAQVK